MRLDGIGVTNEIDKILLLSLAVVEKFGIALDHTNHRIHSNCLSKKYKWSVGSLIPPFGKKLGRGKQYVTVAITGHRDLFDEQD